MKATALSSSGRKSQAAALAVPCNYSLIFPLSGPGIYSAAGRSAHGAAYAAYIGCWRKRAHVVKGQRSIARFEDAKTDSTRSFCSRCGVPLLYERKCSPHMVNIPRALFSGRTGREPRYNVAIEELQEQAYTGNRLVPLRGYPDVVWERPKSRRRPSEWMTLSSATDASRPRAHKPILALSPTVQ